MFIIDCPWCGKRDQSEFSYGGEAHIVRPLEPEKLSDGEWADYLFMRKNTKGRYLEQWVHSSGCRRWFNAVRNNVTYNIAGTYKPGEVAPDSNADVNSGSDSSGGDS